MTMTSPSDKLFDDVMIDIESMSLHPHNALILSIGMIYFDPTAPDRPDFGSRLLIVPNHTRQMAIGRVVDASTQKFWAEQSQEARNHWEYPETTQTLERTAGDVAHFLDGAKRVWANGIQFDLSNLVGLFGQMGAKVPWHYRAPRDMRSICEETEKKRFAPLPDGLIKHEPISDCIEQAYHVWEHK
jgi:hypothetical protein